ncbi:MAG: LLM class flavin-dependent oxidoreductase [Nitrososphaerales archaeon]
MIFGLRLLGGYIGDTTRLVNLGALAEKMGFEFCWFAHDPFMRNSWVTATALSSLTRRIRLGLNFKPYTIDPSEVITLAATLDEYSRGRCVIGLGTHSDRMFDWIGLGSKKITPILREYVLLIRRALSGESCEFKGSQFNWTSECYLRFKPYRSKVPIYISAFGKELLELSGEIGDGSLPMLTPPESVDYVLKHIHAGIAKARRRIEDVDVVGLIWTSISKDGRVAGDVLKSVIAHFGPYLEEEALNYVGLSAADFTPIKAKLSKGDLEGAKRLVSDNMFKLAIVGKPDECLEKICWLEKKGITHISIGGPLGPEPEEAVKLIGQRIIPYFKEQKR